MMKERINKSGTKIIIITILFLLSFSIKPAHAQFGYYGGLFGGGLYGIYGGMLGGIYGGSLYGGLLYGGVYGRGIYGGLYGGGLYGSLYGGSYGLYGGLYGGSYGNVYGGMYNPYDNSVNEALAVYNYLQYAIKFYDVARVTPGLYQQDFTADYIGALMASYAHNLNLTPEEAIVYFVGQNYLQKYLP
ncbi:MAG: hypothetical protein ACMUJM_11280 [bacterium]